MGRFSLAVFAAALLGACGSDEGSDDGDDTANDTNPVSSTMSGSSEEGDAGPTGPTGPTGSTDPTSSTDPTESEAETSEPMGGCEGLVGEGFAVGQIAENWTLNDENGDPVNLHDFCGKVIYFESGSEW